MFFVGKLRVWGTVVCAFGLAIAACATGVLPTDDTEGDASTTDATTNKDGAPTNDAAPTIDALRSVTDRRSARERRERRAAGYLNGPRSGAARTRAPPGDAGSLAPDSTIPTGIAASSGIGWTPRLYLMRSGLTMPTSTCGSGFTDCNGICFDTLNFPHDHCRTCATACTSAMVQRGNCCSLEQEIIAAAIRTYRSAMA